MSKEDRENRREFTRVRSPLPIRIEVAENPAESGQGLVLDISMKGVLCKLGGTAVANARYRLEIQLTEALQIRAVGRCVRTRGGEAAFAFEEMDVDSFTELKNVIAYNASQVHVVEQEFRTRVGLRPDRS